MESAALDHDQLGALYAQLGAVAAEDVLRRTMEDLAQRLTQVEQLHRQSDLIALRKHARTLVGIAEQVGMIRLSLVASDVVTTVDQMDMNAIAATTFRLIRVGERSLAAVWELQDITI